jgi:hypothetical protein
VIPPCAFAKRERNHHQENDMRHAHEKVDKPSDDPVRATSWRCRCEVQGQGKQRAGGRCLRAD